MKQTYFAKWLLDVGKYITTALVITVTLGSIELGWVYYTVSIALVVFIVLLGLALLDDKNDKKKKKKDKKKDKDLTD